MNRNFTNLLLTLGALVAALWSWEVRAWSDDAPPRDANSFADPYSTGPVYDGQNPAVQPYVESVASDSLAEDTVDPYFGPSYGLRFDTGDGVAVRKSFWTPQVFVPLLDRSDNQFLFADLRGVFVEDDLIAANIGLGYRVYNEWLARTLGLYVYYDYRDAQQNGFQQVSPGFELLGDRWDLRSNIYLPQVGEQRKTSPNQFAGNYLFVDRFQVALAGADLEVGTRLPLDVPVSVFGGGYHFQGPKIDDIWGWKVRAEAQWTDTVSTNVSVQNDDAFGTSVNLWAALRFPASRSRSQRSGCYEAGERFYEPVQRFQNIVVRNDPGLPAINPADGQPFYFLHVAGGGNSDGSFESPYGTLDQALGDSRYAGGQVDVVYVRQDPAVRTDPAAGLQHWGDITLVADTQLLGNGPVQRIVASQGSQFLPFSGSDLRLERPPLIHGRVTLGDNTTLSGFGVNANSVSAAIAGAGLFNFNINHNLIANPLGGAIQLTGLHGTGNISRNSITGFATYAIAIEDSSLFSGRIANNSMAPEVPLNNPRSFNAGLAFGPFPPPPPDAPTAPDLVDFHKHAILVRNSTFLGDISGNVIQNFSDTESLLVANSTFVGNIVDNIIFNAPSGIRIEESEFSGSISNNRITFDLDSFALGFGLDGIVLHDNPWFHGNIEHNYVAGYSRTGLLIVNAVQRPFVGNVNGNTMNGNGAGLAVFQTEFIGNVTRNSFGESLGVGNWSLELPQTGRITFGNNGDGMDFVDSVVVGSISANVVERNSQLGLGIWNSMFTGDITGNDFQENGSFGIAGRTRAMGLAIVESEFTGSIRANTIAKNGLVGLGIWDSRFVGDVADNLIQGNTDGLWLIDTPTTVSDSYFTGDIRGNTISDNQRVGLATWGANVTGDITGNTIERNYQSPDELATGHELAGLALFENSYVTGNIANNTISANVGSGIAFEKSILNGGIAGNRIRDNSQQGVIIAYDSFLTGGLTANIVTGNRAEGILLDLAVPDVFAYYVPVVDNQLSANNGGFAREFAAINSGAGFLEIDLHGNSSANSPPLGEFNFDLQNNGGGVFVISPINVESVNEGTVGSSNNSVGLP